MCHAQALPDEGAETPSRPDTLGTRTPRLQRSTQTLLNKQLTILSSTPSAWFWRRHSSLMREAVVGGRAEQGASTQRVTLSATHRQPASKTPCHPLRNAPLLLVGKLLILVAMGCTSVLVAAPAEVMHMGGAHV